MLALKVYMAEAIEKLLLIIVIFGASFVIGAGVSMGAVWGAAYMLKDVQP